MTDKRVTLALAAFMDSPHSLRLDAPSTEEIRLITERFLSASFEDLGRPPEELDGDGLRELMSTALPLRFGESDLLAEHLEPVLEAYLEHLSEVAVLTHSFELKMAFEPGLREFRAAVESRRGPRRKSGSEAKPFVHGASRTGRNDPCPCGSGRKFKHCHGKS
ncbi:MAG: SEC-C domain-containing protein [Planctomycetota bacterium]